MLFIQSYQQREECQVTILINTQHHYLLKTYPLLENLHPMFFKQSSQQREKCQVINLINRQHHYLLKTCIIVNYKTYRLYTLFKQSSQQRGLSGNHFDKNIASLLTQNTSLDRKLTRYVV